MLTWMMSVCSDMTGFASVSLESLFIVSDAYGVLGCTSVRRKLGLRQKGMDRHSSSNHGDSA